MQCANVPIWNFTGWQHPGGSYVQANDLCGTVRYDWLSKNMQHANINPEIGSTLSGVSKIGEYVDPLCEE